MTSFLSVALALDGRLAVGQRECSSYLTIPFFLGFFISHFDSCPSCLVWSGSYLSYLYYLISSCTYVILSCASRFACGFLRPSSRDLVRLGGFRSGSLLVDLVYRMAYLLVRVDLYPN